MLPLPTGLHAMVNQEGVPVTGPLRVGKFDVFQADLESWRLLFSKNTPCIWIKSEHVRSMSADDLLSSLHHTCLQQGWLNVALLIFLDGDGRPLESRLQEWKNNFIILDQPIQENLKKSHSVKKIILNQVRKYRSLVELSPYETNKPVTGASFFGRHEEIENVLRHPTNSYLFVGVHRMGKTSLLKEIKRRLDLVDPPRPGQIRRVYIDCTLITKEEEFTKILFSQLEQSGFTLVSRRNLNPEAYHKDIMVHYTAVHGEPITFLLDEFDRLLTHLNHHWKLLQVIQTAIAARQIRLIAAGYRNAIEAAANKLSPFFNILTPIWLKPLNQTAVEQLVLIPLSQLGIEIEDTTKFIYHLRQETAGLPNYLQYYCRTLLAYADKHHKKRLSLADLEVVHQNPRFRGFLMNSFMSNTDLTEQAMMYAMIAENIVEIEHTTLITTIDALLQKRKLNLSAHQITKACQNLQLAGFFVQEETRYKFAIRQLYETLKQERDVNFLFERAREALQTEKILT